MNFVHPEARLGKGVRIGYFTAIEAGVVLGDETVVGNNVTIHTGTVIGDKVQIGGGAVIGRQPKPSRTSTVSYGEQQLPLRVGAGTVVGANAILYAGSIIGENCLIADLASVREKCVIGDCVVIGRGVAVENSTSIGDYTKIQTGAYITAYMDIEDHVFIAPMVTTTNDNFMGRTAARLKLIKGATIKRGARVGGGSILLPGVTIASETCVAAGSLVTKDTVAAKAVRGLPAMEFREVPAHELLDCKEAAE